MITPTIKLTDEEQARREHFFHQCLATNTVEKKNLNPEPSKREIEYSAIKFEEVKK